MARWTSGARVSSADGIPPLRLLLLGGFTLLRDAEEIEVPVSAQRLVALLALRERPLSRSYLADVLWPHCSAERSMADLRTALWRANHCGVPVVATAGIRLCLRSEVQVDVRILTTFGRAVENLNDTVIAQLGDMSWCDLALDLLPDWYDDWLVDDREGLRQLRLHTLERMTGELSLRGRHAEAIQAALTAVRIEPLRETAHAALIRAHLAEGNRCEALRQFSRFRKLLEAELGVAPSESIRQLIADEAILSNAN
jgi:DNA-binding SARP family transcriptional activator